jgi:DNA-binding response OmpR family regulator
MPTGAAVTTTSDALAGYPPVVVLVGDGAHDLESVQSLIATGAVVVAARSLEQARSWVEEFTADRSRSRSRITAGHLELDLATHQAWWAGMPLPITELELRLLATMARSPNRVCSFAELHTSGWRAPYYGDSSNVRTAIKRLRRKLTERRAGIAIRSVRGIGFRLQAS